MTDYYAILGLEKGASKDEIRRAYRRLAFECHPDKNPSPEAKQKFIRITEAYDALMEGKTFTAFSFKAKTTSAPRPKTAQDMRREKVAEFFEKRREQFRQVRRKYRDGPDAAKHRRVFYGKVYFFYGCAGLVLVVPLAYFIIARQGIGLFVYPFCIGFGLRLIVQGVRAKERADMIFGEEENFSAAELQAFFSADSFATWKQPGQNRRFGPN